MLRNVKIIFDNETHEISVKTGQTILEAALDNNISLPHSCQVGICSSCRAIVTDGKVKMSDQSVLDEEEIEQGECLTCVAYPVIENTTIKYD